MNDPNLAFSERAGSARTEQRDPYGLSASTPGAKLDAGKMRAGLLLDFSRALVAVGQVCTFGAGKYTPGGWLQVPEAQRRYTDALLRHLLAEGQGEVTDPESDLLHAAHAAWNALARLELALREAERDQTPRYASAHALNPEDPS